MYVCMYVRRTRPRAIPLAMTIKNYQHAFKYDYGAPLPRPTAAEEFRYKVFWEDTKQFLLSALNFAHAKGCISITQRRGLITLVPKKNKPANLLKNWRPVTLLNCDYKIAAKSIANRMKKKSCLR